MIKPGFPAQGDFASLQTTCGRVWRGPLHMACSLLEDDLVEAVDLVRVRGRVRVRVRVRVPVRVRVRVRVTVTVTVRVRGYG